MKFEWEENDIIVGRRVGLSNGAAETFMIGYILEVNQKFYCLNSLVDGMVGFRVKTRKEFCEILNEGHLYIPLTLEKVTCDTQV